MPTMPSSMQTVVQLIAMTLVCLLALGLRRPFPSLVRRWGRGFRLLARRRRLAVCAVFLFTLGLCLALACVNQLPEPQVHDELSYYLSGETFAQGRLATPQHPHWTFFESVAITASPTVQSKYPPSQGVVLAAGFWLGHPLWGVWLSLAVACAGVCWMLQAWLPPRWALLGAVLGALQVTPVWGMNYWGGSVALLGGALVFGALRRLYHRPKMEHGLFLGLGFALLANSRPYEGLVVSVVALASLAAWLVRYRTVSLAAAATRVLAPMAVILALAGLAMAAYNHAVTGNPLCMPYRIHDQQYAAAPTLFFWKHRPDYPTYRHEAMEKFYVGWDEERSIRRRRFLGFNPTLGTKFWIFFRFYVGPLLIPIYVVLRQERGPWMKLAMLCCGLVLLALTQTTAPSAHYCAPVACLIYVLAIQGLRRLRLWRWQERPAGRWLAAGAVATLFLTWGTAFQERCISAHDWHPKPVLADQLAAQPGNHLVVVHYGPKHNIHVEYVYNSPDIDAARIVWARDQGPDKNQELLSYFADRKVWLLEVNERPVLQPYPAATDLVAGGIPGKPGSSSLSQP